MFSFLGGPLALPAPSALVYPARRPKAKGFWWKGAPTRRPFLFIELFVFSFKTPAHPEDAGPCFAVTLLHAALIPTKTKRGFLTPERG